MSLRTSTKRKFHEPVEDVANKRTATTPPTSPVSYPFLSEREVMECKEGDYAAQDMAIQAAMTYLLQCRVPELVHEVTNKSFAFPNDGKLEGLATPGLPTSYDKPSDDNSAQRARRHHIFALNSVCEFNGNPCLAVMELNSSTFEISVRIFEHKSPEDYDDEDDYWDDEDFATMSWEDLQIPIDHNHFVDVRQEEDEEIVGWIGMKLFGRMFGRLNM